MSKTPTTPSSAPAGPSDNDTDALWALPASDLDSLYRDRAASPLEVARAVLARVEEANPSLGAFLTVTSERALADAAAAEDRLVRGERSGPLDGVPYSVKDVEPTAGIRTTFGSTFFRDHVPTADSLVASRLRRSGAVLLGKTNTPHLGYKDATDNLVGPTARNPWNLDRTTGGSSGGAAAAVAAGLGPLAQGGDGGGSIRIPASLCGVFGLKPTFGLVPRVPSVDAWDALATVGPITRTVRDAATMLAEIAGPDSRDPWAFAPAADYLGACDRGIDDLRVGLSLDLGHALVDDEVRNAVTEAAGHLAALGAYVAEVDLDWPAIRHAFEVVYETGLGARIAALLREQPTQPIEPSLQALVERSRRWSAVDLREAAVVRTDFYRAVVESFNGFDLLVTPTMPLTAWSAEPDCMDGPHRTTVENILDRLPFTYPFNFTTMPAATLPCGLSPHGLPIGLQLVAPPRREDTILAAAAAYERAHPWTDCRPPGFGG
jgi:Asp-tRNA(Asn)/Glu-tRNA(Gln) amidotransferase A subunit family amidase